MLPEILKQYSNTKHSNILMTPVEASKKKNCRYGYKVAIVCCYDKYSKPVQYIEEKMQFTISW